jgi:hypothetical protein
MARETKALTAGVRAAAGATEAPHAPTASATIAAHLRGRFAVSSIAFVAL